GLDEIETGISVAQAAGAFEMVVIGYGNLSSELQFFGRLIDARRAWHHHLELSGRYGLARHVLNARADAADWAYLDGRWDEALASELGGIGEVMVPALCSAFPTLVGVAWVFRDLGRANEFSDVVLDADPIKSPWNDAARAICEDDLGRAANIIDGIGHPAA